MRQAVRSEEYGRVEKMIRWLAEHGDRIGRPEKIKVVFDCAGNRVSVEVREREKVVEEVGDK